MSSLQLLHGLKPSTLAVALAVCGAPMAVQAATITLSASYSLNDNDPVPDALTAPGAQIFGAPPSQYPTSTGSDFYLFTQEGISNAFFHTYGFVSNPTYFGARASGEGIWTATTAANYSTQFTNNGLAAVPLSLSFNVDSGDLGLFGSGTGLAELILRVRVNGVDVARDQTTITQGVGNVTTCIENDLGSTLASYTSCASASSNQAFSNGGTFTVALGLLGVGQTYDIDYDIISTTNGSFSGGAVNCNYDDGYGGELEAGRVQAAAFEGETFCPTFNGIARSGDPFNLPFSRALPDINFDPNLSVPTPGSLALFGLAGAIGIATRQRRLRRHG
jgi:hypothetical protein